MPMNVVLKEKRKAAGLTQEQVAKRLGVTAPAVNKWEKGSTYPDVTLLPALARLLGTDLNTLMCFERTLSEEEINSLCNEIVETAQKEGFESGYALAERKIQEYPACAEFIHMAAMTVQGTLLFSELDKEKKNVYEKNISLWYEQVIECAEDSRIKSGAAYMLAAKYLNEKELEKAQRMLDLLPGELPDKRVLQARLLEQQGNTEEAGLLLERWIQEDLAELQQALMKLMCIAVEEGDTEYIEQILSMLSSAPEEKEISPLLAHVDAYAKRKAKEKEQDKSDGKPAQAPQTAEKEYRRKALSTLIEAMRSDSDEYEFLKDDGRFMTLLEKYSV